MIKFQWNSWRGGIFVVEFNMYGGVMTAKIKWISYYSFTVMGMIVVSIGAMMKSLISAFQLSYEQGGLIVTATAVASLVMGFFAGLLLAKVSFRLMMMIGNGFYVVGFLIFALAPSYGWLLVAAFLAGLGWAFSNTTINMMMNEASDGDAKQISLLHMMFSIGAFLVPLLYKWLMDMGYSYRALCYAIAAMSAVALGISYSIDLKRTAHMERGTKAKISWGWIVFSVILFFYVGSESMINTWTISIMTNVKSLLESDAQTIFSVFWGTMIVGRFICGFLSMKFDVMKLVLICSLVALGAIVLLLVSQTAALTFTSMFILALAFSGIYPLSFSAASAHTKGSGVITALVITGGGLGSTFFPYISGYFADHYGLIAILVILMIAILLLASFAYLAMSPNQSKSEAKNES